MTFAEALVILGLREDSLDMASIKKAYSRNLRTTRPEDDRDGFMDLRTAYDLVRTTFIIRQQDEAEHSVQDSSVQSSSHDVSEGARINIDVLENSPSLEQEAQDASPKRAASENKDDYHSIAARHAERIDNILEDKQKRNDPDEWRALIQPMREETLDDWIIFDAVLRQCLISHYNADIDRRQSAPEPVAPPDPFIEPSLSTGIFRGMGWDDVSQVDGIRYEQISWLENQMRAFKYKVPEHRKISAQVRQTKEVGFGPEIALGFVFVIIVLAMAFRLFGPDQPDRPRQAPSVEAEGTIYTEHNLEMLQIMLDNEREDRLAMVQSGELDADRELAINTRRTADAVKALRRAPGFRVSPMTFREIRFVIGPPTNLDKVKNKSPETENSESPNE